MDQLDDVADEAHNQDYIEGGQPKASRWSRDGYRDQLARAACGTFEVTAKKMRIHVAGLIKGSLTADTNSLGDLYNYVLARVKG